MKVYNWQQKDWPNFKFSLESVESKLFLFAEKIGRVDGLLAGLSDEMQQDAIVDIILAEAIKTSEIEGEFPNRNDVLSSIRKNLGLHVNARHIKDKSAAGLGELMIDVRKTFKDLLSQELLFKWHQLLMGQNTQIEIGQWRTHEDPMQIISGAMGKETVHFEAPPSKQVPSQMKAFIKWFNESMPGGKSEINSAPVRSAIAHLYFETIHPFEDGNGRIGRAIAEKALSQTIGRPVTLSLSKTIEANKNAYYEALKQAQRSNEITSWIEYFVNTAIAAQAEAEEEINFTLRKTKFYDHYKSELNGRQLMVITRMFDEGSQGFQGGMNARKYIGITKTSKATATRDMQQLVELGVFVIIGQSGGRSTRYAVNL